MTVAFSDTNLLCDMLRPLPTFANKVTVSGERGHTLRWQRVSPGTCVVVALKFVCLAWVPVKQLRGVLPPRHGCRSRSEACRTAPTPADATSAFYVRRKPLSATINTLANALYKVRNV